MNHNPDNNEALLVGNSAIFRDKQRGGGGGGWDPRLIKF